MDPFTIALGVLQITGVAIKVSLFLQKRIKIFRNYSQEVKRVFRGVERQQRNFLHEIHLLLRLAKLGEDDIERMLQDGEDAHWSSQQLQDGLDSAFPRSLDSVHDIMEEFRSTLQALQDELACFDEIIQMGAKNEPLKATVHRVRKKVKITWNKPGFEEHIKNLRDLNDDLRRLREQAAEIKEPVLRSKPGVRPVHQLSHEYGSIGVVRRASRAFHQALAAAWLKDISKVQPEPMRHNVKLKLDTQVRDEVNMEILISCYGHSRRWLQPNSVQAGLLNLKVKSRILDFIDSELRTPPNSSDDSRRKKRKVRFTLDDEQENSTVPVVPPMTGSQDQGSIDLRATGNICTALQRSNVDSCNSKCLGVKIEGLKAID